MGKSLFRKGIILGAIGAIIVLASTYALGEDTVRFQGRLMVLNFEKRMMAVNESELVWDDKTAIYDDARSPIPIEKLKPGSWVFIEAERSKNQKHTVIRTLYLLPRYINYKERSRYPFMQY